MTQSIERLQAELDSARALDVATADILRIIREAPGDLEGALAAIGRSVERLCDSEGCAIRFVFDATPGRAGLRVWTTLSGRISLPVDDEGVGATLAAFGTNQPVQTAGPIEDWEAEYPTTAGAARAMGYREAALLAVPIAGPLGPIGAISTMRPTARPFDADDLDRLERFGAQAAIAIENARLIRELRESDARTREALDVQRVMARVLGIVAGAPSNLESSLPEIAAAAKQLTDADTGVVFVIEDNRITFFSTAFGASVDTAGMARWSTPEDRSLSSVAIFENRIVEVAGPIDAWAAEFPRNARMMIASGASEAALLAVPLPALAGNDGAAGSILVARKHATPFTEAQREILFALGNQAIIAIQNARLFGELEVRNKEITEALRREEASARILSQISNAPEALDATLQAIAETARELMQMSAAVYLNDGGDIVLHGNAHVPGEAFARTPTGQRIATPEPHLRVQAARTPMFLNWETEPSDELQRSGYARGIRSTALIPILRGDIALGVLGFASSQNRSFSPAMVAAMVTFADQAAIAIENARLIRELRESDARTREALNVQGVMAQVLGVVAGAPSDLGASLPEIVEAAKRLTDAQAGAVVVNEGDQILAFSSVLGDLSARTSEEITHLLKPENRSISTVAMFENRIVEVSGPVDSWAAEYPRTAVDVRANGGNHSNWLAVPLPGSAGIQGAAGSILVFRAGTTPFSAYHRRILLTLADQAMIAIQNARLFGELERRNQEVSAALERQEALASVLSVIASSATDAKPVLEAILETGSRLCAASGASAHLVHGELLRMEVATGFIATMVGQPRSTWPIDDHSLTGRSLRERRTLLATRQQLLDEYSSSASLTIDYNVQSTIAAPLVRDDRMLGAIAFLSDREDGFTAQQVVLIETFADQAVIAIDNARLFNELQARNREITEALRREEAGSAILRQISESPEQLEQTLQAIADASLALTGCGTFVWRLEDQEIVLVGKAQGAHDTRAREIPIGWRSRRTEELEGAVQSRSPKFYTIDNTLSEQLRSNFAAAGETIFASGGTISRSMAYVPVVSAGEVTAMLVLANCKESAVPLIQSFADQAAIAIENARLIRELRDSNQTISENLDRQTIMRNVLAIIASAPSDLDATLPQVAAAAKRLCEADFGGVTYIDGDAASAWDDQHGARQLPLDTDGHFTRGTFVASCVAGNQPVEVIGPVDEWEGRFPNSAKYARLAGRHLQAALAVPIPGPGGAVGAILVIRNDTRPFTERHRTSLEALANQAVIAIENARLFNQLQAKTQELEVASRHKSEFLANMSHELRTPLNAIIGYAELLQEECEDLGSTDFLPDLGKIHSAGKHLLTLISGILDLSKVEAGRMTMFLEDFDVATLIRDADAIVRPLVEKNRNTFVIDCPEDIGVMHADLVKVRQVLFNLLSNSAKFTEGGTITLTVRRPVEDQTVTFAIRDTGIGMTEEQLGRLFEAFSQANAETSRKFGGTGLGLALSREFCRMMGGDIAVTSEAGAGSTFTVTLPVQCIDTESAS